MLNDQSGGGFFKSTKTAGTQTTFPPHNLQRPLSQEQIGGEAPLQESSISTQLPSLGPSTLQTSLFQGQIGREASPQEPSMSTQGPPLGPVRQDVENVSDSRNLNLETQLTEKIKQRKDYIQTFVRRKGRVTHFNFDVSHMEHGPIPDTFEKQLREIYSNSTGAFKINASLGMILQNKETKELRYYAPGPNLLSHERPVLIHNSQTYQAFLKEMKERDMLEWATRSRPTTKFVVIRITNILYEVTRTKKLIGCGNRTLEDMAPFINNTSYVTFLTDSSNRHNVPYQDNLCLFRCLALHYGANHKQSNFEVNVLQLYRQFIEYVERLDQNYVQPEPFPGISLMTLPIIEECFKVSVFVYDVSDTSNITNSYNSMVGFPDNIHLGLYKNHFMLMCNTEAILGKYVCPACEKIFKTRKSLLQHRSRCPGTLKSTKLTFKGQAYRPSDNIFEKLEKEFGIVVPSSDRFHPYVITYDFESLLGKQDKRDNTDKLSYDNIHIPISVAIGSNVEGYKDYKFLVNKDPAKLIREFVLYLVEVSRAAGALLRIRYNYVIKALEDLLIEAESFEGKYSPKMLQRMIERFTNWLYASPVLGFNSSNYDLKLCRKYLFQALEHIGERVSYVIKKGGSYTCINTTHLKFLDIVNYLAPGFSYDSFLRAYKASVKKLHFPYAWLDSVDKLDYDCLPSHELKGCNISEEEYAECQQIWCENNFKTFVEYLELYNSVDVTGFVEALETMLLFYNSKGLDPFKESVTLPGIVERYLYKTLPPHTYFRSVESEDVYNLFRNNIFGGPSIVFHRHHAANKTKIRYRRFGNEAKDCKKIIGFDANSLYLWALAQEIPTGPYVVRESKNYFQPQFLYNDGIATCYLEYVSEQRQVFIQHALNGSEKTIKHYKLDGYIPATDTCIEFLGCYYHGCPRCTVHSVPHPTQRGKSFGDLYHETLTRNSNVRKLVRHMEIIWECEALADNDFRDFISNHRYNERQYRTLTEKDIIDRVLEGSLFGCVECDVEVPSSLSEGFQEFPPIFKTCDIPFRCYGEHMTAYAEQQGISESSSTTSLISSLFGKQILFTTPLLRWYLNHGLCVSNITKVIHFHPQECFDPFKEEVSQARLEGARDPSKEILAQTFKLWGNSAYGRTVMRKENHTDVH